MSYHKILWGLEAARLIVWIIILPWNLTGTSAAMLPRYLSNFRAIAQFWIQILRLQDLTKSYIKTSIGTGPRAHVLLSRGQWGNPEVCQQMFSVNLLCPDNIATTKLRLKQCKNVCANSIQYALTETKMLSFSRNINHWLHWKFDFDNSQWSWEWKFHQN